MIRIKGATEEFNEGSRREERDGERVVGDGSIAGGHEREKPYKQEVMTKKGSGKGNEMNSVCQIYNAHRIQLLSNGLPAQHLIFVVLYGSVKGSHPLVQLLIRAVGVKSTTYPKVTIINFVGN